MSTSQLNSEERGRIEAFAEIQGATAGYVHRRFERYPTLVRGSDAQGLACFGLVHEFERGEARYLYAGPWFSRTGTYVPVFVAYFLQFLAGAQGRAAHFAAEFESAVALGALRGLLPSLLQPSANTQNVSNATQLTARTFAQFLGHVELQDAVTLRTRCAERATRPGGSSEVRRPSRLTGPAQQPDAQLVIATIGPTELERAHAELNAGLQRAEAQWQRLQLRKVAGGRG